MFYLWFAKNQYFKNNQYRAGQIMPFLLIVLAILLAAAVATVRIGRKSVNKTISANMADAGALAAASGLAAALNNLALENQDLYLYYLACVSAIYDADGATPSLIDQQIALLDTNTTDATDGFKAMMSGAKHILIDGDIPKYVKWGVTDSAVEAQDCACWSYYSCVKNDCSTALNKGWAAAINIYDTGKNFKEMAQSIKSAVDSLKSESQTAYCQMSGEAKQAFADAEILGRQYAIANGTDADRTAVFDADPAKPFPTITRFDLRHTKRGYPEPISLDFSLASGAIGDFAYSKGLDAGLTSVLGAHKIHAPTSGNLYLLLPYILYRQGYPTADADYFGINTGAMIEDNAVFYQDLFYRLTEDSQLMNDATKKATTGCVICTTLDSDYCVGSEYIYKAASTFESELLRWVSGLGGGFWATALKSGGILKPYYDKQIRDFLLPSTDVFQSFNCDDVKAVLPLAATEDMGSRASYQSYSLTSPSASGCSPVASTEAGESWTQTAYQAKLDVAYWQQAAIDYQNASTSYWSSYWTWSHYLSIDSANCAADPTSSACGEMSVDQGQMNYYSYWAGYYSGQVSVANNNAATANANILPYKQHAEGMSQILAGNLKDTYLDAYKTGHRTTTSVAFTSVPVPVTDVNGLIIICLEDVIYTTDKVTCTAINDGVTSTSTATFDGGGNGNLRTGGYYPVLTEVH